MQTEQLLKEKSHTVTVTVGGSSIQDVTGKIFQAMRKKIFTEIEHPIIQMEAEEVYFEKVETKKETERFLFLFWPREKVSYVVTAKIIVKVKYLDIKKEEL